MQDDPLKQNRALTILSLLSILLVSFHLSDDVTRGIEPGDMSLVRGMIILAVWLLGALALAQTRLGYVILLLGSLLGMLVSIAHLRGAGIGASIIGSSGGFFFVWTLIALGASSAASFVLAVFGFWTRLTTARKRAD